MHSAKHLLCGRCLLNEWLFPAPFQQESEKKKTNSIGNLYTEGSSTQKNFSTSDSGNYGELLFLDYLGYGQIKEERRI